VNSPGISRELIYLRAASSPEPPLLKSGLHIDDVLAILYLAMRSDPSRNPRARTLIVIQLPYGCGHELMADIEIRRTSFQGQIGARD